MWPKKPENEDDDKEDRAVVPWVAVLATVGFSTLSWLCVRPGDNTMSDIERVTS